MQKMFYPYESDKNDGKKLRKDFDSKRLAQIFRTLLTLRETLRSFSIKQLKLKSVVDAHV